jgi:hypothetical protein
VRTNRYKLIHFYYDIDEWELYDLRSDPDELNNIYNAAEFAELKKELHARLDSLMAQYKDSPELAQKILEEDLKTK